MTDAPLRDRLLAAALELLARDADLSLREVARRAGVSHQAPYHHFADKESLLAALGEAGFDALSDRIDATDEALCGAQIAAEPSLSAGWGDRPPDPVAALIDAGRAYIGFALDRPAQFRLMFRFERDRMERHEGLRRAAARALAQFERRCRDVAAAGLAPEGEGALLPLAWGVVHGTATLLLDGALPLHGDPRSPDAVAEAALQAFEARLRPPRPR